MDKETLSNHNVWGQGDSTHTAHHPTQPTYRVLQQYNNINNLPLLLSLLKDLSVNLRSFQAFVQVDVFVFPRTSSILPVAVTFFVKSIKAKSMKERQMRNIMFITVQLNSAVVGFG